MVFTEFCCMTYKPFFKEHMRKSSVLNIRGHQPNSPDVVPAAEIHLYNVMNETARWSYLCHLPPLLPHQYNELLVYRMCEMHQRNVTLCVCLSVCVCMCLGEAMCTYPPHCFYCYQTGHLF